MLGIITLIISICIAALAPFIMMCQLESRYHSRAIRGGHRGPSDDRRWLSCGQYRDGRLNVNYDMLTTSNIHAPIAADVATITQSSEFKYLDTLKVFAGSNSIPNYTDLGEIKYNPDGKLLNTNCHLGQRKLLLTEIEFYADFVCDRAPDAKGIVIYAGSASCEHLPVILDMFPNLKFILVDPNFHLVPDFMYIYQRQSIIPADNLSLFRHQLRAKASRRMEHLSKLTSRLQHAHLLFGGKFDALDVSSVSPGLADFESGISVLIDKIISSDCRVFVIQDYMTEQLSTQLRRALDVQHIEPYFLTDIRTALFGEVNDIDIIWNYALQIIFLKTLRPKWSMLKFRPPFFEDFATQFNKDLIKCLQYEGSPGAEHAEDPFSKIDAKHHSIIRVIRDDIEFVKRQWGIDMIGEYSRRRFSYFAADEIRTQVWAPVVSTESRMFVSSARIDAPFVEYSPTIWEDKFYYFNAMRKVFVASDELFARQCGSDGDRSPGTPAMRQEYDRDSAPGPPTRGLEYDRCYDCMREAEILNRYLHKYVDAPAQRDAKLSHKYAVVAREGWTLDSLYNLICKYTFFRMRNPKCPAHGSPATMNPRNLTRYVYFEIPTRLYRLSIADTVTIDGYFDIDSRPRIE